MSAIIAALALAASYIPQLVEIGVNVAPLVVGLRNAIANLGTPEAPDAAAFASLDATVSGYETQFADAVAAHNALVAAGPPAAP